MSTGVDRTDALDSRRIRQAAPASSSFAPEETSTLINFAGTPEPLQTKIPSPAADQQIGTSLDVDPGTTRGSPSLIQ